MHDKKFMIISSFALRGSKELIYQIDRHPNTNKFCTSDCHASYKEEEDSYDADQTLAYKILHPKMIIIEIEFIIYREHRI